MEFVVLIFFLLKNIFFVDAGAICNIDLGMTDGGILNFQISASSFLPSFIPSQARPFYNGWCSDPTDSNPFIQVTLSAI